MTLPDDSPSADCPQDVLDLLFNRRHALYELWKTASDARDVERMRELGCRQEEVSGLIRALRGARS